MVDHIPSKKLSIEHGCACLRNETGWLLWSVKLSEIPETGTEVVERPHPKTPATQVAASKKVLLGILRALQSGELNAARYIIASFAEEVCDELELLLNPPAHADAALAAESPLSKAVRIARGDTGPPDAPVRFAQETNEHTIAHCLIVEKFMDGDIAFTMKVPADFRAERGMKFEIRPAGKESRTDTEEAKLVAFFRSPEGDWLGRNGDYDGLSPAETAIRAIRRLSEKVS